MSTSALIIVVVIAVVVVGAIALILRNRRSERLRNRFGPEYGRAIQETGSKGHAEAKLEKLEKRVERFNISPLSPADRVGFIAAWQTVQARFVDDPKGALTDADKLIEKIVATRGYPVTDFEQRAADISVDHPLVVEHYRAGHEIALRHSQGRASTEDMRQAMIHYRTLFGDLAGEPAMAHAARGGRG
jgi:hypothetical protein